MLGGGAGLLAGLGMLAIPGVGPVVAAGWLIATAVGAGIGAAGGGLLGSLVGAGVSETDAHVYAEGVRRGGTLVTVRADEGQRANVEAILARYSGVDAATRGTEYRAGGWETVRRDRAGLHRRRDSPTLGAAPTPPARSPHGHAIGEPVLGDASEHADRGLTARLALEKGGASASGAPPCFLVDYSPMSRPTTGTRHAAWMAAFPGPAYGHTAHINRIGTAVPPNDVHQAFIDFARTPAARPAQPCAVCPHGRPLRHRPPLLPSSPRRAGRALAWTTPASIAAATSLARQSACAL